MKAIVQSEYGSADVLRLAEVAKPVCDDESVLVKVKVEAASVNAGDWHLMTGDDWHLMTGDPFFLRLMFGGLLKPKVKTLGFSRPPGEWKR